MPMPTMPLPTPSRPQTAGKQSRLPAQAHATDCYTLWVNDDECLIRAILVESIDCLFSSTDEGESVDRDDPMSEPLLDQIDDQRVQFHGQLAAPPRARRRQKLVASRAVFHAVVRR
jgi:hypothetical protein